MVELAFSAAELGKIHRNQKAAPAIERAVELLRQWLTAGPTAWGDIERRGRASELSPSTLRRAATKLGVIQQQGAWALANYKG